VYIVRSFFISPLPSRSRPTRRTHKLENVQTAIRTMFSSPVEGSMVNYWFSIPYLPRWLGVPTITENVVLSTTATAMMSTAFAPSWRGTWMRTTKAQVGRKQSGGTDVRWPFEWRLRRERSAVGSAARTRSTQRTSTRSLTIFQ